MKKHIAFIAIGTALVAASACILLFIGNVPPLAMTAAFVAVGVGCGLLGHGLGEILAARARAKDPEAAREIEIEQKDERNLAINNRAKARAYDVMIYAMAVLLLVFALSGIGAGPVLALVAVYLFVMGVYVAGLARYQREM